MITTRARTCCVMALLALCISTRPALADTTATIKSAARDEQLTVQDIQDILSSLPDSVKRLLLFTECFGGYFVEKLAGSANTAVTSAATKDKEATYTGYDQGASNQLKPEAGNTGKKVHDAGNQTKKGQETPQSSDTNPNSLKLQDFSLDPVSDAGAVYSRHILVYAGGPNDTDKAERDKIVNAFKNDPRTTVTTMGGVASGQGGGGKDGWQLPASASSLNLAIRNIADAIKQSPHPEKEQFIFFVGDHGSIVKTPDSPKPAAPVTPGAKGGITGFRTFNSIDSIPGGPRDIDPLTLTNDPNNVPGFSFFVPLPDGATYHYTDPFDYTPFFQPGDWSLTAGGHTFTTFTEYFRDRTNLDAMIIGDAPDEGFRLFFPVPESLFISDYFDTTIDFQVTNLTSAGRLATYSVSAFQQETGAIAKVPEPASLTCLLAAGLLLLGQRHVSSPARRNLKS